MATSGAWFGAYNGYWLGPLEANPGAAAATLSGVGGITANLTAAPVTPAGKSHTNLYLRQILTEYYEAAFNKPRVEPPEPAAAPSLAPARPRVRAPAPRTPAAPIEALISAAEQALANKPVNVVSALVAEALKFNTLVADFEAFERRVAKRRADEDSDLLLLAALIL